MTLYETPERHAANPPESWDICRTEFGSRVSWELRLDPTSEYPTQTYGTKKAAEAARREGFYFDLWHKESRWYAGESIPNWKPYAEIRAEREARDAKQRRKVERAGLDADKPEDWRAAGQSGDVGRMREALAEVLDWFENAEPVSLDAINADEAATIHRDLSAEWGLGSDVEAELHRVQVLNLGADRTAEQVLEDLRQAEREAAEALAVFA